MLVWGTGTKKVGVADVLWSADPGKVWLCFKDLKAHVG